MGIGRVHHRSGGFPPVLVPVRTAICDQRHNVALSHESSRKCVTVTCIRSAAWPRHNYYNSNAFRNDTVLDDCSTNPPPA